MLLVWFPSPLIRSSARLKVKVFSLSLCHFPASDKLCSCAYQWTCVSPSCCGTPTHQRMATAQPGGRFPFWANTKRIPFGLNHMWSCSRLLFVLWVKSYRKPANAKLKPTPCDTYDITLYLVGKGFATFCYFRSKLDFPVSDPLHDLRWLWRHNSLTSHDLTIFCTQKLPKRLPFNFY